MSDEYDLSPATQHRHLGRSAAERRDLPDSEPGDPSATALHASAQDDAPYLPNDPPIENITESDLMGLLHHLEELLAAGPDRARGTLMRQSEILDAIFNSLVASHLRDAIYGRFTGDADPRVTAGWLGLALQTQKQCADTLKAASTMEYLESISSKINKNHR